MDKNIFESNARQRGFILSDDQLHKFDTYHKELLVWNKKINLVSYKSSKEIPTRHFLNSLTIMPFIPTQNARMLDIGSGAGFPGLPLKIAAPVLELHLMESNRKKVSFLKHIIRKLQLDNVYVVHNRAEHVIRDKTLKNFFDIVVSRAAFHLPEFISLCAFFLTENGIFITLKSSESESEFSECVQNTTVNNLFELFQYDTNLYPQGKSSKIIVGKKIKKDKKIF